MISLGVTTTAVYTLQVAYGPANGSVTIQGQSSFPTNGSQNMTLTCLATEVNPRPRFSWSGVKCRNGNQDNTCIFQPQPISDDHKRVACIVTSEFIGTSVKFASAIFIVDLLYPPMTPPVLTSLDKSSFLRNGDVINCTVKGGKPAVTSVTFACSDPFLLTDQPDVMDMDDVSGVTSVVSGLRVQTSRSRESRSLMCSCVAKWLPEESLYTAVTSFTYPTEYKASVTNFTFLGVTAPLTATGDDISAPLTVTENDVKSVTLTCSAEGRPHPNISLSRMGGDGVLSMEPDVTTSSMSLNDIRCEMTGVYICSVNNGLARILDQKLLSMAVLCGARAENSSEERRNRQTPPVMTRHGLTFRLVSNPVPDTSVYTIVNATTAATGALTPSLQNARLFVTSCRRVKDVGYMALCKITPRRVTSQQLGVYAVSVGNGLGSYDFHFKVEEEIIPLPASVSSSRKSDAISAAAIAGGILGTVLIIVILIIIGFVLVRRKWTGRKMGIESESPKTQDTVEFSEHNINSAFVDTEAIDVTVPRRAELPRQPSSNFSTSSSFYDEVMGDDVSRSSLHPPPETDAAAAAAATTPDRLRNKRSPRVSFCMDPDQAATPRSITLSRSSERSPRDPLGETHTVPPKSPRYKSNDSNKALKSPRNKQIKGKGPKSPRHKLNEARFPKKSPRNSVAISPPQSPRNNAFMTEEDETPYEERPSTSMSGDYAEIDCDGTPRNGRPDLVARPRSKRSDYADIVEDPQHKPSPRFRGSNNGVQPSGSNTPTPLPRGSVRGPLGDIYRTIDKALKDGERAKPQKESGNWVGSGIEDDGNNNPEDLSEPLPYSGEEMGGSYDDDNAMGDNFGDSEQGDLPGAELSERAEGHRPGTKLKPVRPYLGSADVDADVYNDAMSSSRGRNPVKITSL